MRAHEFMTQPRRKPAYTLRSINRGKRIILKRRADLARNVEHLYPAMYGNAERARELLDLELTKLALLQQRAGCAVSDDLLDPSGTALPLSWPAVDDMADDERERRTEGDEHVREMAVRNIRLKKP